MYKVYIWVNKVNGKKYVGATKDSLQKRAGYKGRSYVGSPRFYAAIRKYGFQNFQVTVVKEQLTKQQAAETQKRLIQQLNTTDPRLGYNLQKGGFPQQVCSEGSRRSRISNTLKKQRGNSQYREVMSARMKKVWDDPVSRASLLAKRALKPTSGRPRIKVYCQQTGVLYDSLHDAGKALGISYSCLSARLKKAPNGRIVIGGRSNKPIYTLHRKNSAH